jgi:glycosyltransferase involved in cell wall biosynthesis
LKNILFITEHSPFKTNSGANQRSYFFCLAFSKFANVDVLTIEQDIEFNIENCLKIDINNFLKKNNIILFIKNFFLLFFPPIIVKILFLLNKLINNIFNLKNIKLSKIAKLYIKSKKYDFIFVRTIKILILFGIKPDKNIILDIDDLPEQIYKSKIQDLRNKYFLKSFLLKIYYSFCVVKYRKYTNKILNKIFIAYLPNKQQCFLLNNTLYLPNIPYINNFDKKEKNIKNQILFIGKIEYQPNYTGIEHFLNNIFPLILEKYPDVIINIIGYINDDRKSEWQKKYKNIIVSGFVNDIISEYNKSYIVIVPIYNGGGTNIKVIEAMNFGKACVISSFAARGFESILENGKNIFIADNDNNFAQNVIMLLENEELRENIGKKAKESVNNNYSFDYFSDIIVKSIN